jgi:hypothetical protein
MARSLRLEARLLRTHLFRLVFVFFIYMMMSAAQIQSLMRGAPGLWFFTSVLVLNLIFVTGGGLALFPSAITEEKEENTIGLLMMTGLSPLGILFGKSTARMLQALLLLTVQFPFTLLAITLGGVLMNQVLAAYASLLAYIILLSNVSLLWSVVCKRTGSAAGLTAICIAVYGVVPPIIRGTNLPALIATYPWSQTSWGQWVVRVVDVLRDISVFNRIGDICQTGFADPPIGTQVVTNVAAGLVCFLLSWALFSKFALHSDAQGVARSFWTRPSGSKRRRLAPGRAWINPLIWKDYHFLTGGTAMMGLKLAAFVVLYPALFWYFEWLGSRQGYYGDPWENLIQVHLGIAAAVFGLEACIYASRIFHDEIREQTMVGLLTLPRSIEYVAYSKVAGCLLALVPSVVIVLIDACLLPEGPKQVVDALFHPAFWTGVLVASTFLHMVVLLSLFVKWGALPLAFVMTLMTMYCCPFVFIVPMLVAETAASLVGIVILLVLWGVSCFVFQMMIHARLYELGSK